MNSEKLSFSICIPVYKGSHLLWNTLSRVIDQDFRNYEILIGDDNPPYEDEEIKKTQDIIASFHDERIKYHKNEKNLGYAVNLRNIVSRSKNEIIFLLGQDDILARDALQKTHDAFFLDDDVGVVTRPYFWFMDDINKPVRVVAPYDSTRDSVLSLADGKESFLKIFESVGQLSGLAYRREFLFTPFNDECFPAHIYPFAGILKKHKCVFLKDYTVAIGIRDSQTRSVSSIYDLSPTESWLRMYKTVFSGKEYEKVRTWGIEHITTNFVGLIQIKNYAKRGILMKEIGILIRERKKNMLNMKFWFFVIGTILIPRPILVFMVDWYKTKISARLIVNIKFI